jgi:hypothetical protein
MKRSPLRRRSPIKRRTTSPRCSRQRCNRAASVEGRCITHAEQDADRAFSVWVRARDGTCTAAVVLDTPCGGPLQAAHIIGRANHTTRFSPDNVHAACRDHHMHIDQYGSEAAKWRWATAVLGERRYTSLMIRGRAITKRADAVAAALARRDAA